MRRIASIIPVLAGLFLAMAGSSALAQSDFQATYQGSLNGGSCGNTFQIKGKEPFSGSHPVFIYLVGTWEQYDTLSALKTVNKAADLGFVAAAVQYDSGSWGECNTFRARSKCVFDKSTPKSAIEVLCSRAKADCSKGVVVAGFSQGSLLAMMARNFDPRIRAVYGMGSNLSYNGTDVRACVGAANRDLPNNRLRVINGEGDTSFGNWDGAQRANFEELTGLSCPAGHPGCWRDNDSGWFVVPNNATSWGWADHCYMRQGGCNTDGTVLDQKWTEGTYEWSLGTNLKWLKTFTDN